LMTVLFLPWYWSIIQLLYNQWQVGTFNQVNWFMVCLPLVISLGVLGYFGWFLPWLYRVYALDHDNFIAHYLSSIEIRQLLSLLVVSKGFYDTDSDDKGQYVKYFPKIKVKFLFKTGQLMIEQPVDGQKYMQRFSKGEFDLAVEIALLADKQVTEFAKNKMISTFAFEPIKFRYKLLELQPQKSKLQIAKGIDWKFDTFYNALISGNVGTGKSYTMFSIIGQLLTLTKFVEIIDPKRDDLASLKYIDDLKDHVASEINEILAMVLKYYDDMEDRSKKIEQIKSTGRIGSYFDFNFAPHFLVFDEYGAFKEFGESLQFQDENYNSYNQAMSRLNEIAMKGRSLGFYLIIGMQKPDAHTLPTAIRAQLNLRINMGIPANENKKMMFPNTEKELHPLSRSLKGWGFIQSGNDDVRSFFAPEIPKNFNLHDYIRGQIAKRTS
ncbi:FtsK/SpoIIIE domain-containing protein, partial [Leuconostoc citreum]|uniref:FtsK/SpoIIIE domain-containing protein n=1 Tax=Leuconostoc citreum TaxID=33964 RepID=UPI0032DFCD34